MLEKLNSLGSIALIALAIAGPAGAAVTLLDKEDWKFQIGGFAELDMITDSTRSLTEVAGSSPIARPGGLNGENGRTQFSPRNSRLFFALTPPVVADWKTKGHVEVDLLGTPNGPSEGALYTSPTLRLRHAFLSAETNGFQVLAGQYWTLFGWQTAYLPPTVQVPPVTGVAYERTPQLLVMKSFGALQAAASIFRPVQRDAKLPGVDGGLRYTFEGWKGGIANSPTGDVTVQSMSVAVTGTVRGFETPAGTGSATDKTHQTGYGVALDAMIPILPASDDKDPGNSLVLSGEVTTGEGYGDQFPGWSGNLKPLASTDNSFVPTSANLDAGLGGFDTGGTFHLVKLSTFNVNLQYQLPSDWHTYLNVGYAQLHSSNAASLTPVNGTPYFRSEIVFGNVYHDFSKQIRAGFEYAYSRTKYGDGVEPHNHRFQLSTWFRL